PSAVPMCGSATATPENIIGGAICEATITATESRCLAVLTLRAVITRPPLGATTCDSPCTDRPGRPAGPGRCEATPFGLSAKAFEGGMDSILARPWRPST